jgi:hypothetical protein
VKRSPGCNSTCFEILEEGQRNGRRFVRFRVTTHSRRGAFRICQPVIESLKVGPNPHLDVRVTATGVQASGRYKTASLNEFYPRSKDPWTLILEAIEPQECIEVDVSPSG